MEQYNPGTTLNILYRLGFELYVVNVDDGIISSPSEYHYVKWILGGNNLVLN